jgi:hypothetical protein
MTDAHPLIERIDAELVRERDALVALSHRIHAHPRSASRKSVRARG